MIAERSAARSTHLPAPPPLYTTARHAPHGILVTVHGELDLATAPHLEAALCGHLRNRPQRLTLDLSAVTFIDCSGLNVLLRTRIRARHSRTCLRLGPVSPRVARLLMLTGSFPRPAATASGPDLAPPRPLRRP